MPRTRYSTALPYETKDGSEIRELMHPTVHSNRNQSLAEAIVAPGAATHLHRHHLSEELYHITAGIGLMRLGEKSFEVAAGDTVCILPGTPHAVTNTGKTPLHILCCCAPPYAHDDTELLE